MTKYDIAQKIRDLLDLDISELVDAALELADTIEYEAEAEYEDEE